MLILLALVNLLLTGWFVYESVRNRELDFFLWGSLLAVFAIPFVVDALNVRDGARQALLAHAILFAIGFNMLFWGAKRLFLRHHHGPLAPYDGPQGLLPLFVGTLGLAVGLLLVHIYVRFGLDLTQLGMMFLLNWRDVAFDNDSIYRMLSHRMLVVGSAACLLAWVQKRPGWFSLSMLMVLLATLLEGARFLLVPAFAPIVYYTAISGRFRVRSIAQAAIAGLLMLFVVYHVQTLRYEDNRQLSKFADIDAIITTVRRMKEVGLPNQEASGELRLRGYYYHVLDRMPGQMDISWGRTYRRLLLFPFPTSLMGGIKPTEYTREIANLIYPERKGYGGTVHPLLYGESYANFGDLGIIVGALWGCVFALLGRWFRKQATWQQIVLLAPIAAFGVFLARGAVYSSVVFLVYGVVFVLILWWCLYCGSFAPSQHDHEHEHELGSEVPAG